MNNNLQQTLLNLILETIRKNDNGRQVVYLEGGYFDTRFGPKEFSTNTLNICIKTAEEIIKKKYKIMRVILGVLINNIGINCDENICTINGQENNAKNKDDALVPTALDNMIKKSKIGKEDQIITNERTLRNRGIRTMRDILSNPKKYSLGIDEDTNDEILYSLDIEGNKIPLAIERKEHWIARCPLIMGQHYVDLYVKNAKKYGKTTNQLLIDMCDIYDRHKVNNGAKVSLFLLRKMYGYNVGNLRIVNFSFNDDELTNFEYDITE